MSKADLKIRPIYHRLEHRICAHIALVFIVYGLSKTLETVLKQEKSMLNPIGNGRITVGVTDNLPEIFLG